MKTTTQPMVTMPQAVAKLARALEAQTKARDQMVVKYRLFESPEDRAVRKREAKEKLAQADWAVSVSAKRVCSTAMSLAPDRLARDRLQYVFNSAELLTAWLYALVLYQDSEVLYA